MRVHLGGVPENMATEEEASSSTRVNLKRMITLPIRSDISCIGHLYLEFILPTPSPALPDFDAFANAMVL